MKKDSAKKKEYSTKKLNKIMGYVLFGTVFLMSFIFIDQTIRTKWWWLILAIFGGLILIEIVVWIILYFQFKKKSKTENDLKIEEAIKKLEQEQEEVTDEQKENEIVHDTKPVDIKG